MAWVTLNATDVLNSLTEQEQTGISTPSAQSDLAVIVTSVTNLVRGKVNSAKRNQGHLGPVGTIPDELYAAAISISRFKYLTHLPGTQLITKWREQDNDEALAQLQDVADGKLVIVRGDDVNNQTPIVDGSYGTIGPNQQGVEPDGTGGGLWWSWGPGWPFWDGYW